MENELKKCYTCGNLKEKNKFNKNRCRVDGLNSICKECSKQRSRRYYKENRKEHLIKVGKRRTHVRELFKIWIKNIKSIGCCCCDEKEPVSIDFHHLFNKKFVISSNGGGRVSFKSLSKEINKCILLCSNCHRKYHAGIIKLPDGIKPLTVEVFSSKLK